MKTDPNKTSKRVLVLIAITNLIEVIGFSMIIPILPLMFTEADSALYVLAPGTSAETGYWLLGILFSLYVFGQFFANPILGQLSDKYGRRKVLLLAVLGTALSNFLFGFGAAVTSLVIMLGARLFDGITGGSIAIINSVVADISTAENRAKNFGIIGAGFGVGFMLGPLLGGVLSNQSILPFFGVPFAFTVSGILSLINVLFIYRLLPETSPLDNSVIVKPLRSVTNIARAFRDTATRWVYSLSFLYAFGFTMFTSFFGVLLVEQFGYSETSIGLLFFYLGALIIPFQTILVPFAAKRYQQATVTLTGLALLAGSLFVIHEIQTTFYLLIALVFFSAGNSLTRTAVTTMVSRKASGTTQGKALGIDASVQALGQALPSLIAGFIAATFGPSIPILLAGFVFVLGIFLVSYRYKNLESFST